VSDAAVLSDLARARRSRRTADIDIFERLYQAYLTAIGVLVVVVVAASLVGDEHVAHRSIARIAADGPAWVGIIASLVLVIGLRSGSRGGPLTLEPAFVAHVLLSPVGRDDALRPAGTRQLGQAVVGGGGVGAIGGLLAAHRLPLAALPIVAWAAVAGTTVALAATGAAMVVAGFPIPKPAVHLLCIGLMGGSIADVVAGTAWSPGSIVGRMAVSGVHLDLLGLLAVPVAAALAAGGVAVIGGLSIEAARRRAGLVSQLRFAVTRQDLRTVVLLQRRLAQDSARRRPWIRIPGGRRLPVFRRGLRGLARLPLVRLLRVLALCTTAVLAAVGAYRGTSPLIIVSGLALWAAALDVIEPLAQELDHPDRWAGYPVGHGDLLLRHLAAPIVLLVVLACVPVAVLAAVTGDSTTVLSVGAGVLPLACGAAVLGAAASVAMAPFEMSNVQTLMPETVGTQMLMRVLWPPAVPVLAALPVLAARHAAEHHLTTFQACSQYAIPITILVAIVGTWLTRRKPSVT
jgi:hypothetical protein